VIACSTVAQHEQLAGTAPVTSCWIVVEHSGPWGRTAVADALAPRSGARVLFMRQDYRSSSEHQVFVAVPELDLFHKTSVEQLDEIASWSIDRIRAGDLPGHPAPDNPLLICTNGARDRCCAVLGRELLDAAPVPVWQCTHVGGHRFAPVVVRLRDGYVFGRVTPDDLIALAQGETPLERARGRAHYPEPLQLAEITIAQRGYEVTAVQALSAGLVLVRTPDRDFQVHVRQHQGPEARPESCGREPVPVEQWLVDGVE